MTEEKLLAIIEEETGLSGLTLDSNLEALDSLDFMDLMLKCDVPVRKIPDVHTVGDILKAL